MREKYHMRSFFLNYARKYGQALNFKGVYNSEHPPKKCENLNYPAQN